jgi:hypothetical protein
MYLVGAKASLNYTAVASSLSSSWAQANTGIVAFSPIVSVVFLKVLSAVFLQLS